MKFECSRFAEIYGVPGSDYREVNITNGWAGSELRGEPVGFNPISSPLQVKAPDVMIQGPLYLAGMRYRLK